MKIACTFMPHLSAKKLSSNRSANLEKKERVPNLMSKICERLSGGETAEIVMNLVAKLRSSPR